MKKSNKFPRDFLEEDEICGSKSRRLLHTIMTVFPHKKNHVPPPTLSSLDAPRVVGVALHLAIPAIIYYMMQSSEVSNFLQTSSFLGKFAAYQPLSEQRKNLYLALNCYYAIRWSFGLATMNTDLSIGSGTGWLIRGSDTFPAGFRPVSGRIMHNPCHSVKSLGINS